MARRPGRSIPSAAPDLLQDFEYDPVNREIVLTNGSVLDPIDGAKKKQFLGMKDCTSIAIRPGGGYIGRIEPGQGLLLGMNEEEW